VRRVILSAGLILAVSGVLASRHLHHPYLPRIHATPPTAAGGFPGNGPPAPARNEPAPGARILGRVQDSWGLPVPGAVIEAIRPRPGKVAGAGATVARAMTDSDGRFELAAAGEVRVTARRGIAGFAEALVRTPGPHVLRFDAASWIEGRVVGESGAPVVASLTVNARPRTSSGPAAEFRLETDGAGRFNSGPISPALIVVAEVRAPGHQPVRIVVDLHEGCAVPAFVVLQRGTTAEGVVRTEDGAPVAGAVVETFPGTGFRFQAVTDAEGRYRIDGLDGKPGSVTVRHEGCEPHVGSGGEITLRRRTDLVGRIEPLRSGLHVVVVAKGVRYRAPVGPGGGFRVEGVPRGMVRLDVETEDRRSVTSLSVDTAAIVGELTVWAP